MGNILVFLQQTDGSVSKASLIALTAASELKDKWGKNGLVGVCLGPGSSAAAAAGLEHGLSAVYYSEDEHFTKYLAAPYAQAVQTAFSEGGCDILVGAATSTGKDFFPRVAAAIDAGQASDIIGIGEDGSLKRPMYAGNVFANVEILTEKKVITVRGTAYAPAEKSGSGGETKELTVALDGANAGEVLSYEMAESDRPELTDAEVVVSGGRALQSAENFEKYIFPLADALGAGVGASRAAVDSGYVPNDWQVGQTGKVVAPNLYVAVGISGAIQHLAGMKDSKVIVAINKDPDAPIFEVADYGLVADLYEVIEPLTQAIKKAKAS